MKIDLEISVIIPAHNTEKWIAKYLNWAVILADEGLPDHCPLYVMNMQRKTDVL